MGYRTKAEPDASQGFLRRVCNALDYSVADLAKITGIDAKELRSMVDVPVGQIADINKDNALWMISKLVDTRLAQHLAIRHELSVALTKQREQQAARLASLRERSPTPLPPRRPPLRSGR